MTELPPTLLGRRIRWAGDPLYEPRGEKHYGTVIRTAPLVVQDSQGAEYTIHSRQVLEVLPGGVLPEHRADVRPGPRTM